MKKIVINKKPKKILRIKKKSPKPIQEVKRTKTVNLDEPEIKGIIFKNFQIIRLDKLNWAIEPKNEKGEFSKTRRKYFPRFESALVHSLEEMTINKLEETELKNAIQKIGEYKDEIIKAIKKYGLDG